MKANRSGLFWGFLLICAGVVALGQQLGYIQRFSDPQFWIWVFAFVSLLAVAEYALSGWRKWGWLFPAGIFGGLALVITLGINNVDSAAVASPLFFGMAIPFAGAYLTDRTRNWWALIPGGIMLFMAVTMLLIDNVNEDWVGVLFLLLFGLSFLIVYLADRTRLWALLVAYIFGVVSIAPMLSALGDVSGYFGSVIFFAVALPFYILYFRSVHNWWAIIPAGVMTVIGVVVTLAIAGLINDASSGGYVGSFVMGGLAATFAVVWLRNHKAWAKIVTTVLGLLAITSLFFTSYYEIFWPIAIILGGLYLLVTALRPRSV